MKTLQIIKRDFKGVKIQQRSDNKYLCLNDILTAYNRNRDITENKKRLDNYLQNEKTKELIEYLQTASQSQKQNTSKSSDLKSNDIKPILTKRGKNGGTYANPLIAIDFAMWLSIEFKVWALNILNDSLIQLRNIVGDDYKELTQVLSEYEKVTDYKLYMREANMINKLVWGGTYKNKRNNATQEELDLLKQLQKTDIKLIKEGKPFEDRQRMLKRFKELL